MYVYTYVHTYNYNDEIKCHRVFVCVEFILCLFLYQYNVKAWS